MFNSEFIKVYFKPIIREFFTSIYKKLLNFSFISRIYFFIFYLSFKVLKCFKSLIFTSKKLYFQESTLLIKKSNIVLIFIIGLRGQMSTKIAINSFQYFIFSYFVPRILIYIFSWFSFNTRYTLEVFGYFKVVFVFKVILLFKYFI